MYGTKHMLIEGFKNSRTYSFTDGIQYFGVFADFKLRMGIELNRKKTQ